MLLPACNQRLPFLPGPVILGAACLLRAVAAGGIWHLSFDSPGLMKEFEGPRPKEALGWEVHITQSQFMLIVPTELLTVPPLALSHVPIWAINCPS